MAKGQTRRFHLAVLGGGRLLDSTGCEDRQVLAVVWGVPGRGKGKKQQVQQGMEGGRRFALGSERLGTVAKAPAKEVGQLVSHRMLSGA